MTGTAGCRPSVREIGRAQFVLLTTFRRSGAGVPTPVWVTVLDDRLAVVTPAGSGKVERLGHDPTVTVQACSPRGVPRPGAPVFRGTATVTGDQQVLDRVWHLVHRKYWLPFAVLWVLARLRPRLDRFAGAQVVIGVDLTPSE